MPFRVTYTVNLHDGEHPDVRIDALRREQSAELPSDVICRAGMQHVTGEVIDQQESGESQISVTVAWPVNNAGRDLTQLLNILWGNISLQRGIQITGINWQDLYPDLVEGPALGINGLRRRWHLPDRALACAALKPMGSSPDQLAALACHFALGGIDLIKDDHGLTNQPSAPFEKRVAACCRALDRAAEKTGRRARYLPNITADPHLVVERYQKAAELGADGVLLAPMLVGPALMHHLARIDPPLPVMAHPACSGGWIARNRGAAAGHGFDPGLFYGGLWRALGADFSIYPNTGGRFSFSRSECLQINEHCRNSRQPFAATWPAPAGGIQSDRIEHWQREYGPKTVFLIGGSLYQDSGGIEQATARMMQSLIPSPD